MIKLFLERITDANVRQTFETLDRFLKTRKMLADMQFFELSFDAAVTNMPFVHTLGAVPKDVIQTRITGAGVVTYNYELFTERFISISTTGPCKVRFFVGTHKEE